METSTRHFFSACHFFTARFAGMSPRHRCSFGFRGVHARPNRTFYTELRYGGFCLTLSTYDTQELAARV
jgi:hypothetical protein